MRTLLTSSMVFLLVSMTSLAQDTSYETFHGIRFENSSNPGVFITLTAPTGSLGYTLVWPASKPTLPGGWSFSTGSSDDAMGWFETPSGEANQIGFFSGTNAVVSNSSLTWTDTSKQLGISSTLPTAMLSLSKSGVTPSASAMLTIENTQTSSIATTKTLLSLNASGTMAAGSSVTGLVVDVSGATNNYAATFTGGNVGIGTSSPGTRLDVAGDIAYREYNYTGTLDATNDNFSFVTGNNYSFIRIGTSSTSEKVFTGFAGGYNGKLLILYNATGNNIRLKNETTSSTSANRIKAPADQDIIVTNGASYQLIYSGTDQRWVVAFAGPGQITTLGNKEVTVITSTASQLPSQTASYVQVNTDNVLQRYDVTLEDGLVVGQILVVQNKGPKSIAFTGANIAWDNNTLLQAEESIIAIWNGAKWIQVAEASN